MKRYKLLLIGLSFLLLIVGCVFAQDLPSQLQIDQMSDKEKEQLYNDNKKNPLLAGILDLGISLGGSQTNFVLFAGIPSLGHAYVNKWRRGLYLGLGSFGFSMIGMFNAPLGYAILYAGHFLQGQDAIYLANKYNADLYKRIYNKEYIKQPKKSLIQKLNDIK